MRRDVICLGTVLGRFRVLPSPSVMGNERHKLVMGNPSPLARCFLSAPWPIAISPQGICFAEGILMDSSGESQRHIAFDDIGTIMAVEKEVHALQAPIAVFSSHEQAENLAAMLREVAAASEADRGRLIGAHLDRWTDDAAAVARFAELKKLSGTLRASGFTLFLLAFLVGPALYFSPWTPSWITVLFYFLMLFSTWMLTVWDYAVCRKRLLGERFWERFRHVGMLLLSPASAMRSSEVLLRNGLAEFHPLAAAAALCRAGAAVLARPMLLALEHPTPGEVPGDPAAGRIDAWFRKKLLKRLHSLLRRAEIDPAELLRPAKPLSDSRSYCPRCHNQFVLAAGTCPDCGGLALVAYGGEQDAERSDNSRPKGKDGAGMAGR